MPAKSKETPAAKKRSTTKRPAKQKPTTEKSTIEKSTTQTTTTRQKAEQKIPETKAPDQATIQITEKKQAEAEPIAQQTMLEISEEKMPLALEPDLAKPVSAMEEQVVTEIEGTLTSAVASETNAGNVTPEPGSKASIDAGSDRTFLTSQLINENIWAPNNAIPTLDEATYAVQKAQAEAQRRAIEVASLNLQNINELRQLEQQSIDVAISAKNNETRNAQLAAAGIDYQTQLEMNGEKSQHLRQAAAKHQAATRESGYTDQLIALKDQNFELEIEQAQNVFAEKAARYRAQLTGQ